MKAFITIVFLLLNSQLFFALAQSEEEIDLLKNIFNKLYQDGDIFFMNDILELFKNYPSLININSKYTSHRNIDAPKV